MERLADALFPIDRSYEMLSKLSSRNSQNSSQVVMFIDQAEMKVYEQHKHNQVCASSSRTPLPHPSTPRAG
jgi:hypothetical protein